MATIRSTVMFVCCFTLLIHAYGCRSTPPADLAQGSIEKTPPPPLSVPKNNVLVFFARNANFYGGGRTHILRVDDRPVGRLTGENYYRLEMWPGQYEFSVDLPREEFFGQVSPPSNISRQITLKASGDGSAYFCTYTDGHGSSGLSLEPIKVFPQEALSGRNLAKSLTTRDTAQVTEFLKTRYDGPAAYDRPHGEGTLTWPDGSQYKGTFSHGEPTRKARFFFSDGRIFMGPYIKGRPAKNGLLMNADGEILFAGDFENEQPHGVGLRTGANGPEFCIYEKGKDITKSFRQLAGEALDMEDPKTIASYLNRIEETTSQIEALQAQLTDLAPGQDPDQMRTTTAQYQKNINALEKQKKSYTLNMEADNQAFIEQMQDTRFKRELTEEKMLRKSHAEQIEKERQWCRGEFDQGRNLCICAPFAVDFDQWDACWELQRPRFLD